MDLVDFFKTINNKDLDKIKGKRTKIGVIDDWSGIVENEKIIEEIFGPLSIEKETIEEALNEEFF